VKLVITLDLANDAFVQDLQGELRHVLSKVVAFDHAIHSLVDEANIGLRVWARLSDSNGNSCGGIQVLREEEKS